MLLPDRETDIALNKKLRPGLVDESLVLERAVLGRENDIAFHKKLLPGLESGDLPLEFLGLVGYSKYPVQAVIGEVIDGSGHGAGKEVPLDGQAHKNSSYTFNE